jgi:hypothetical protein
MAMTMDRAVEVLGINRTREGDLAPMIKALGMMPFLNTAEDNERREAAQFVTRRWPAYQAACNAARDLKR